MITVTTEALVTYACTLTDEDEKLVFDYIEQHPDEFDEDDSLEKKIKIAVEYLFSYSKTNFNLYHNSYDVDCNTQEILEAEYTSDEDN